MTDRPVCPECQGPLETTADRGQYGPIAHWAICVRCQHEWMIRWLDGHYRYDQPTTTRTKTSSP